MRRFRRFLPFVVLLAAACDDPFGPSAWDATPDTITIYSASRAELAGFFSVVDIVNMPVSAYPLESPSVTGQWDFALTDFEGGLAITPASAFIGLDSRARVTVLENRTLDDVRQAPRDTSVYTTQSVRVQPGNVYVVRSRRRSCSGVGGYNYAKLRPVAINVAAGSLTFEIVRNPFCDNRSFIPPED